MPVRAAAAKDVEAIARVQVASWDAAYRGSIPDSVIDRLTVERRIDQWSRWFADPPARSAGFVAEAEAGIVGMAFAGPTRDDQADPRTTGEIQVMYVHPDHWRKGHGTDLMEACLGSLRAEGFSECTLWVLAANDLGRRFYEQCGWSADGVVHDEVLFGEALPHARYRRPIR